MTDRAKKPRKQRRNTRACDQCSKRSVKCKASTEDATKCQNCVDFDEPCTLERPLRKRAAASTSADAAAKPGASPILSARVECGALPDVTASAGWNIGINVGEHAIHHLVDVFFDVIFPVFPLFHKASLKQRLSQDEHRTDQPFSAVVFALCALVSARIRDGAVYLPQTAQEPVLGADASPEAFFEVADGAIPKDAALTQQLGYMQACVLLALFSIQSGKSKKTQYYLNLYHTFVAVGSLHDEDAWPPGLGSIEIDERRRLFWSTYTLDVFTSTVWKRPVRGGEADFSVSYPSLDDHEWIAGSGNVSVSQTLTQQERPSWLDGWNFVTDLYRILEHVLRYMHPRTTRAPSMHLPICHGCQSTTALLEHVIERYRELHDVFKHTSPITGRLSEDLYSFQAANIAATVQLVRMVLFTVEGSSVEQKCQIASEVICVFAEVPTAYLRAISTPLLYHLTGIGMTLGSTFKEKLSDASYIRIRSVLLELATLIANLENGMYSSAGTSAKLRTQVAAIDDHWNSQKSSQTRTQVTLDDPTAPPTQQAAPTDALDQTLPSGIMTEIDPVFLPPQLLEDWSWVFDLTQDFVPTGG